MVRRIIEIDAAKCNGCGLCADICHEGAIGLIDGKAALLRDDYCDGLGDCLPKCPTGAICFVEREALAYDAEAVMANQMSQNGSCCSGSAARSIERSPDICSTETITTVSELRQWPVQIKLAPVKAPYYNGADLLIAADCAAYARANFHSGFMRGRITLIGCPKLDGVDYSEKLTGIIADNDIQSLTVARMEVPCCGGIEYAAVTALKNAGKPINMLIVTVRTDGTIKESLSYDL